MEGILTDLGLVAGGLLVVAGVAFWSLPAALIIAGVLLTAACYLSARAGLRPPPAAKVERR